MIRLLVAICLALITLQSSDVLTLVVPDTCTEDVQGSPSDPCADGCPRCVCCARVPAFVPQAPLDLLAELRAIAAVTPPLDPSTTASPRGVFHVPKHS